jgi:hypothetical protein
LTNRTTVGKDPRVSHWRFLYRGVGLNDPRVSHVFRGRKENALAGLRRPVSRNVSWERGATRARHCVRRGKRLGTDVVYPVEWIVEIGHDNVGEDQNHIHQDEAYSPAVDCICHPFRGVSRPVTDPVWLHRMIPDRCRPALRDRIGTCRQAIICADAGEAPGLTRSTRRKSSINCKRAIERASRG